MPLFHPSENRAIFVLTCVLSVSGGFITDSRDKGVERGCEPVTFTEHVGKVVLSAVTHTKGNTLLSFGQGADVLLWVILAFQGTFSESLVRTASVCLVILWADSRNRCS